MRAMTFQRLHPFRLVLLVEMAWSAVWLPTATSGSNFWWLGALLLWPVFRLLADRMRVSAIVITQIGAS